MNAVQKQLSGLQIEQSQLRERLNELLGIETRDEKENTELDTLTKRAQALEPELRAALILNDEGEAKLKDGSTDQPDAEMRERIELRSKASVGRYLAAAVRGRALTGAEHELVEAANLPDDAPDGAIPIELWDVPRDREARSTEHRVVTDAPMTTGINLDTLRPMIFAPSVVDQLSVQMPMVKSGTYATGTINSAATADAVAKGADVPETEAGFVVQTTKPHRIGASLNLAVEDIAAVGVGNFESILREHISLVLSDEIDSQLLNGDDTNNDLIGFFERLADPTVAPAAVSDFDAFAAAHAFGIDGLWASKLMDVNIVCGPATMELSARTFQTAASFKGELSAAAYAEKMTGGFFTNKRMPDAETFLTVDDVQQAILCRKGRAAMPNPMRLAVVPHWGYLSIDDIYSGAAKGERRYVVSVLIGDLILVQPNAYRQVAYKVA